MPGKFAERQAQERGGQGRPGPVRRLVRRHASTVGAGAGEGGVMRLVFLTSTAKQWHTPEGESHVMCCRNSDIALCGTDVTDLPIVDPDSPATCVVCADLEECMPETCSVNGLPCPCEEDAS